MATTRIGGTAFLAVFRALLCVAMARCSASEFSAMPFYGIVGCPRGKPAVVDAVVDSSSQSGFLEQGNFQLWMDQKPVQDLEVEVTTRELHTLTIERTDSYFRGIMVRLEGGENGSDTSSAWIRYSSGLQPAESCTGENRVGGVTHVSTEAKQLVSLDLYLKESDRGMVLDITVIAEDEKYFYSRVIVNAGPKAATARHRRLEDSPVPSAAPSTSTPTSSPTQPGTNNPTEQPTPSPTATPTTSPTTVSPTISPTISPTTVSPTISPTTVSPTISPTISPTTVSPTLSPTISPTRSPTLNPTSSPTTFGPTRAPTPRPSPRPTSNPSVSPSEYPTNGPSLPPSHIPTGSPSSAPSSNPTRMPTTSSPTPLGYTPPPTSVPSKIPTQSPSLTDSPTPQGKSPSLSSIPTKSTPVPTRAPTQAPTNTVPVISGEIAGALLTLLDVGELNQPAQQSFADVMDAFLESVYDTQRRRLRELAVDGIVGVEISTTFRSQQPTEGSNTITYDQTALYKTLDTSVTLASIATGPFNVPELNKQFRDSLRRSNNAFIYLPDTPVAPPVIPVPTDDDDKPDFVVYIIVIGAAVGALIIASIVTMVVCRRRIPENKQEPLAKKDSPNEADFSDNEDPPPPKRISSPNDRRIEEIYEEDPSSVPPISDEAFEYHSVSTMGFDYNKVLAGDYTVMSESQATMDENARRESGRPGMVTTTNIASQDSLTVDEPLAKHETSPNEKIFEVTAPSGMLGVVIVSPDDGPPVVHAVKESSVLRNQIKVGDKLLKVDDDDVTGMTAVRVSRLISQRSGNNRKFTLMRHVGS